MPNLVVVAIPSENDYVWKISSEKVPHMTILFLGEMPVRNFADIAGFVGHAAKQSITRFGMDVDRRDILGPEVADVLFFSKSKWAGYENIAMFRSFLLQDSNIRAAYEAIEQFPEWLPHLTLGYPETPAKPDNRDYPGISYVQFDKIALWFNDYEGFEYPLKNYEWDMEVAMSEVTNDRGWVATVRLLHAGVKGMKWGVRRKQTPSAVTVTQKGKKLKSTGGANRPASSDAIKTKELGQVLKKSGIHALSNEDLQTYSTRLNMEANAKRLNYQNQPVAKKFVANLLGQTAKTSVTTAANEAASKQVKKMLLKTAITVV